VQPKQRLAGLSITSHGPPSIRQFTLTPHIDPDRAPVMEPGCDPGEQDRFKQELGQYVESQSVSGMTLAPAAAPPADASLANLAGQISHARSLRWISTDAAARELTDKLQAARAAIARRQLPSARDLLSTLRAGLTAQRGKTLTSDAVALVDLNIRYVLSVMDR